MPSDVEIGVWVEGAQKWVTGVSRRTSCHDVIKALLRSQNLPASDSVVNKYVLVERWRKVERPLDHEQRILKVWKTWGEAVQEVRFTLRRLREEGHDSDTGSRVERSRRRQKLRQGLHAAPGSHSRKGAKSDPNMRMPSSEGLEMMKRKFCRRRCVCSSVKHHSERVCSETMERLMRLVVAQGETIQAQLGRMHERDQQIEAFEQQLHLLRVQSLGSDYLLHSYLQEPTQETSSSSPHQDISTSSKDDITCEEKSNDSGVVTEETPENLEAAGGRTGQAKSSARTAVSTSSSGMENEDTEEIKAKACLLDKLEVVLNRLMEREEHLFKLERSLAEMAYSELSYLKEELSNVTKVHSTTMSIMRQNELQLRELDTLLYQRRIQLEALLEEDAKYEQEALALQTHLDYIIHLPPTAFKLPLESNSTLPVSQTTIKQNSSTKDGSVSDGQLPVGSSKEDAKSSSPEESSAKSVKKNFISVPPTIHEEVPPPIPSSSPPPLDGEDDKDSGKTASVCVSSSSSTSSEISPSENLPCQETSEAQVRKGAHASKDSDSADSNSDTGLSSLHSSSDEAAFVLDTLV